MTTPNAALEPTAAPIDAAAVASLTGTLWLLGTAFFSLLAVYFIGVDQGMTSVFGHNLMIHEFVHDGRHLLGFPCH